MPGWAWNEAERRAIPFGLIGFFVSGAIVLLRGEASPGDPLLFSTAAIGAVGLFFGVLIYWIVSYHKRFAYGVLAGLTALLFFGGNVLWIRHSHILKGTLSLMPTLVLGIVIYGGLHWAH